MKLTFNKNDLNKSISIVLKAISSKTTMNILECILIDASTDKILFTGNDLELGIQTEVVGNIIEKGKIAIDAKLFSDLIRKLPDEQITIETDSKNEYLCKISCNKKNYTIQGMSATEYTDLPRVESNTYIKISQLSLKDIINQTIFSLSINDTNPIITGELFENVNGHLRVTALDNHRIALRKIKINYSDNDEKIYSIIPGKSLKEIANILSNDNDSEVTIYFTNKNILFEFENTKIVSRVIEGNYLNINKMFSNDCETKVNINRKELIDAIDTQMVFIKENEKRPIIFNFKDDTLNLFIKSSLGEGIEEVSVKKEGKDLKIGFNPKFLLEALKVIEDEIVTLSFVNSKSPCFIKDEEETYLYLILPVNFIDE